MGQTVKDFEKFEKWMRKLPIQTLTDELKEDIITKAYELTDL